VKAERNNIVNKNKQKPTPTQECKTPKYLVKRKDRLNTKGVHYEYNNYYSLFSYSYSDKQNTNDNDKDFFGILKEID